MNPPPQPETPPSLLTFLFPILFGTLLGLSLLKFGNPCILEKLIDRPTNSFEWLINPWPTAVGFVWLGGLVVLGFFNTRNRIKLTTLTALPLIWLIWQFISATQTVSIELTRATLFHFTACVVCFYLGLFALPHTKRIQLFFYCLSAGLLMIIAVGWRQHYGGLAETRKYFFAYLYPQMTDIPPDYLKKISSDRIFSTLFYPNALAGALLLLLPIILTTIWRLRGTLTMAARSFLLGTVTISSLACLYWSKSKGGWLLALFLGLLALLRLRFDRRLKTPLLAMIVCLGLVGFGLRFASYFQNGATSMSARADYWCAATQTAAANPILGTGPGTFAIPYKQIKKPESEMARLVHNDYLQQASDSGFMGGAVYLAFVAGSLWAAWRKLRAEDDWLKFSAWLGLAGWSLQGFLEFGLYIPALAWTAFALFGWLLGSGNPFDTSQEKH